MHVLFGYKGESMKVKKYCNFLKLDPKDLMTSFDTPIFGEILC